MSIKEFEAELGALPQSGGMRRYFLCKDFPLSRLTSFHIGGPCDLAVYPADADAFVYAISTARRLAVPYTVLGNGSNTLVGDRGVRGVVLITTDMRKVVVEGEEINAGCGVLLGSIGTNASHASLSGAEFANGIPGTLGGAIYMNAGAYGGQMSDIIKETTVYDVDADQVQILSCAQQHFSYRHSIFMEKNYIILSARLSLHTAPQEEIFAKMRENLERRREKQPLVYPSAGSVFKRPEGYFAGRLIEDAGLKGMRVGDAAVSEKHAGFIVNLGHATAQEVRTLISQVQKAVYEKFGVSLECEIRFLGEF